MEDRRSSLLQIEEGERESEKEWLLPCGSESVGLVTSITFGVFCAVLLSEEVCMNKNKKKEMS